MKLQRGIINSQTPEITDIREVTRADLSILTEKRSPASIQTIRDNHHRLARCIASGMRNDEAAETCGISINRVSVLRSDPAMEELVAHYRSVLTAEWATATEHYMSAVISNRNKAEAMLSDKLDDAAERGEFLPTRDLIAISRDAADRTGYGKVQKNINVNVDFAARLEKARRATEGLRVIEGRAEHVAAQSPAAVSAPSGSMAATPAPSPPPRVGIRRM